MRNALTCALIAAGLWCGGSAHTARALDFGVNPPVTSPEDKTPKLKGWIIVKYAANYPSATRPVKWVLINEDGEEDPRPVGKDNPHECKKGDYGIRFSAKGAADKYVDFTLIPKNKVTIVVTK